MKVVVQLVEIVDIPSVSSMETWKNIRLENFEHIYAISNLGVLKSLEKTRQFGRATKTYPEKIMKPKVDKDGYLRVKLSNKGKQKMISIHRLVALTFLPNPNNYPVVNHKNGIKTDNRVENLEWCTVQYNTKHAFDCLGRKGNNGGTNKPVVFLDKNTKEIIKRFDSMLEASRNTEHSLELISRHCSKMIVKKELDYIIRCE